MKLYDLGLVVGRFQMPHKGHEYIINHALELCERVVVYVGSAQAHDTEKNPFSYIARAKMLEDVFETQIAAKRLIIRPLYDIGAGNTDIWGRYILGLFEEEFGKQPDLYVTGCEKERPSWFPDSLAPSMTELRIPRNIINVSASMCRELVLNDEQNEWKKYVPYQLYKDYKYMRTVLTDIERNKEN